MRHHNNQRSIKAVCQNTLILQPQMLSLVTRYLIQRRNCVLPCIGEFSIERRSAVSDVPHKAVLPPVNEIIFTPATDLEPSKELICYIAREKKLDEETAEIYLKNYCEEWTNTVLRGGKVHFKTFGTLEKSPVGKIYFRPERQLSSFFQPVHAELVMREDVDHPVLVGDKETSASQMVEYFNEEDEEENSSNRTVYIISAILFLIAAAAIVWQFYVNGISMASTGNSMHVEPASFDTRNISRDAK